MFHMASNAALVLGQTPGAALVFAALLAASLIGLLRSPALIDRCLFRPYWLVRRQQWPTLVTSGFVHADLAHLAFNAFTYWGFAFTLERTLGTSAFLTLYFAGLVAGNLGTWWQHREKPAYASLGASGAILAVLFASIIYHPSSSMFILPIPIPIPAPLFALGYLGYSLWASRRAIGQVNHDAHLAGALVGLGFVALTDWPRFEHTLRSWLG